jgi:hypothetical protein
MRCQNWRKKRLFERKKQTVMKSDKQLQLTFGQKLNHFGTLPFLLFLSFLFFSAIQFALKITFFRVEILPAMLAIISTFWGYKKQKSVLFFEKFKIDLTDEEFKTVIKATAIEHGWTIKSRKNDFAQCLGPGGGHGSLISLEKKDGWLFLNSICNPNYSSISVTGQNAKNIINLRRNFSKIKKSIPILAEAIEKNERKEADFWTEKEWTFDRTMKRLVGYFFSLLLISICFLLLFQNISFKGIWACIFGIACSSTYLYADLKILYTKWKVKNKK